jgi:ribosomal protein S18 acetylase RimI-like enzyme
MVQLIPMSESEYQAYSQNAAEEYAREKTAAGNWHPDEALERAKKEFHGLLPKGIKTENHFLFSIVEDIHKETVGMIWFMLELNRPIPVAFIYDFIINESFRHHGYGEQALQAAEKKAQELGAKRMELHVFAHNHAAIALYEKDGFHVTNLNMAKQIG